MQFIYLLLILAAAYIVFLLAPTVVMYKTIFCRKRGVALDEMDLPKTYFYPFAYEMRAAEAFFSRLPASELSVTARDGTVLRGDYYPRGTDKTAVLMHGYRALPINNFGVLAKALYERGFNILLVHQRGHGKSGGKHTELGLIEQYDLLEWIKLVSAYDGCEELLLGGVSMGCAAIAYASDKINDPKVKAMLLDCGYSSPYDQFRVDSIKRHLPWRLMLPYIRAYAKRFLKIDIKQPVSDSLKKTAIPALFIHGTDDMTVPLEQGLSNFESCSSEKELITVPGANHATALLMGGREATNRLYGFINKYFTEKGTDK